MNQHTATSLHQMEKSAAFIGEITQADMAGSLRDPAYMSACVDRIAERMVKRGEAPSYAAAIAFTEKHLRELAGLGKPEEGMTRALEPEQYSAALEKRAEALLNAGKGGTYREALEMAAREMGTSSPAPSAPPAVPVPAEPRKPASPVGMASTGAASTVRFSSSL
jgi:hypothetical protein